MNGVYPSPCSKSNERYALNIGSKHTGVWSFPSTWNYSLALHYKTHITFALSRHYGSFWGKVELNILYVWNSITRPLSNKTDWTSRCTWIVKMQHLCLLFLNFFFSFLFIPVIFIVDALDIYSITISLYSLIL